MTDNLDKIRKAEERAEPVVDNGLRWSAKVANAWADSEHGTAIGIFLIAIALLALAWVRWG